MKRYGHARVAIGLESLHRHLFDKYYMYHQGNDYFLIQIVLFPIMVAFAYGVPFA